MDLQAYINGLTAQWQKERAGSQMTLGSMIAALEALPDGYEVDSIGEPDSYRGYYCDLAFAPGEGRRFASDLLKECKDSMGQVFTGYKGGEYMMGANTPVWVAHYGSCGQKLMGLDYVSGAWLTTEDD